jgi:asparagine N-glycosylation enzyme membrane subunit Stt3
MWSFFYISGNIPELSYGPYRIFIHLVGEITTAFVLIAGGIGAYYKRKWGNMAYFLGTGMLIYTLIVSPGYYLQNKNWEFVLMFSLLIVITITLLFLFIKKRGDY